MRDHQPKPDSQQKAQPSIDSRSSSRRISIGLLAGISTVLVLTGSATAWWRWNFASRNVDTKTAPANIESPAVEPSANAPAELPAAQVPEPSSPSSPIEEQTAEIYWLDVDAEQFELVASPVALNADDEPSKALKATLEKLLEGPVESAAFSEIPEGTELREVTVEEDGVHIDLSRNFTGGGGSASMTGRLGQVIYTATSLEPNANVWISVEGEPLEVLGGEGLIVDQPMTRDNFEQNFTL